MKRSDKGLTLYEMLAALAIVSIVIVVVTSLMLYSGKGIGSETSKAEVMRESRTIMGNITKTVRSQAADASKPSLNTLKIDFKESDGSGPPALTGDYAQYAFTPPTGNIPGKLELLNHRSGTSTSQLLSDSVSEFVATLNNDKLSIVLKMVLPNNQIYSSDTVIYLRD